MMTLSDNIVKFTNKVEESLSVMTENCSTLTAYMESPSGKEDSSEQLRKILKEEEANKKYACDEEKDKKSRENSLILYGMSEDVELVDCSKELLSIAEHLKLKPKILYICRLGKFSNEAKPRPVRMKLDSTFIRQKFIANSYKLKNHPRLHKVFIKPDLTIKERVIQKELWQELKNKISSEPHKRWVRKGDSIVESSSNKD